MIPVRPSVCSTLKIHLKCPEIEKRWSKTAEGNKKKLEDKLNFSVVLTYLIVSITNFKWAAIFVSDKRILSVCLLLNHWYVFKLFNLGIVCQKSNYGYSKWCNLCALCSRDIKKNGKSKPIHSPSPKNELFFRVWCEINYTITITFMDFFLLIYRYSFPM